MRRSRFFKLKGLKQTAEELADPLPPLLIRAERIADNVSFGLHGRKKPGAGESFWNFRQYVSGDATSQIDWRQSAKSDDVYIREKESEAPQTVWLWRDNSASMQYRSSRRYMYKLDCANLFTLAIASLLTRGGERYTFLGANLPPSSGRMALRRMAQLVDSKKGEGANIKTESLPGVSELPPHSSLILIGDFLSPPGEIQAFVKKMTAYNIRGHLLRIFDPAEESLPFEGRIRFLEEESGTEILIPQIREIRQDYQGAYQKHIAAIKDIAHRANWTYAEHSTDGSIEHSLLKFYSLLST